MSGPYTRFKLDKNNYPYPNVSDVSKQVWSGVPTSSSVIGLSPDTTVIEVTCLGGQAGNAGILLRWGSGAAAATAYDEFIVSGTSKLLAVPASIFGTPAASVAGANAANGLYNKIAVITATAQSASVFGVEYGN